MYKSPPAVLSKDLKAINSEPFNLDAALVKHPRHWEGGPLLQVGFNTKESQKGGGKECNQIHRCPVFISPGPKSMGSI